MLLNMRTALSILLPMLIVMLERVVSPLKQGIEVDGSGGVWHVERLGRVRQLQSCRSPLTPSQPETRGTSLAPAVSEYERENATSGLVGGALSQPRM